MKRPYAEAIVDKFPSLAALKEQLRFGNLIEIPVSQLAKPELDFLVGLYQLAGPEMRGRAAQLLTLQRALNDDGVRFKAEDLEAIVPAIAGYLLVDAIRGWLFNVNAAGKPLAYVVDWITHRSPTTKPVMCTSNSRPMPKRPWRTLPSESPLPHTIFSSYYTSLANFRHWP